MIVMNITNLIKLINQGQTIKDKVNLFLYLFRKKNGSIIKMNGPNETVFIALPNFDYTIWHNFIDYDKNIFEEIKKIYFDKFIDIGANVGKYSIILKKTYPKINVLAFEPIFRNRKVFNQNCYLNKLNITIKDVALSDKVGIHNMFLGNEGNEGAHSLIEDRNGGSIEVNTDILNNYSDYFSNNTLIKIDVEGAELKVLYGGKTVIKKFKPTILFESHTQKELKEISAFLEPIGYTIKNIEDVNYVAVVK